MYVFLSTKNFETLETFTIIKIISYLLCFNIFFNGFSKNCINLDLLYHDTNVYVYVLLYYSVFLFFCSVNSFIILFLVTEINSIIYIYIS